MIKRNVYMYFQKTIFSLKYSAILERLLTDFLKNYIFSLQFSSSLAITTDTGSGAGYMDRNDKGKWEEQIQTEADTESEQSSPLTTCLISN